MSELSPPDEIMQDIIQTLHVSYADKVELVQTGDYHALGKDTEALDFPVKFMSLPDDPTMLRISFSRAVVDPYARDWFESGDGKPFPLVVLRVHPTRLFLKRDEQSVTLDVNKFGYYQDKQGILRVLRFVLDLHIYDPRELSIAEG